MHASSGVRATKQHQTASKTMPNSKSTLRMLQPCRLVDVDVSWRSCWNDRFLRPAQGNKGDQQPVKHSLPCGERVRAQNSPWRWSANDSAGRAAAFLAAQEHNHHQPQRTGAAARLSLSAVAHLLPPRIEGCGAKGRGLRQRNRRGKPAARGGGGRPCER